jgi:ATP-dependent DNA helicase RecQ
MALKYPISVEELIHIGVGRKAKKYGKNSLNWSLRSREWDSASEDLIKSAGIKSASKLYIIQNVDRSYLLMI